MSFSIFTYSKLRNHYYQVQNIFHTQKQIPCLYQQLLPISPQSFPLPPSHFPTFSYAVLCLCPWDSPGKNGRVGCHALLEGIFPTQGSNTGLPNYRQIFHHLSHQETQEYWRGQPIPSPGELTDPGIEPGSLALQVDSLPAELPGKPPCSPKQPLIYFLFLQTCLSWIFHINGFVQYVVFCDWVLIFEIMFSKFNQLVAHISTLFLYVED